MPWRPLPRIAFAVAIFPFQPSSPADLPLELGDELYIIEQGGANGEWYRGYLVAPPSLLAGLTSVKGQTLEARVFSGIFPKNCVEIREVLGDAEGRKNRGENNADRPYPSLINGHTPVDISSLSRTIASKEGIRVDTPTRIPLPGDDTPRTGSRASTPKSITQRDPNAPKPAAPVPMLKIGDETPTSFEEPLVDEIASCLREWHSTNLHELLLTRKYGVLENMSDTVLELDLARRQLLHDVLTAQEKSVVRKETVWNLVKGNKMLTGEVIVRDPKQQGRLLTGEDSAIELTMLQSQMSMLEGDPAPQSDPVSLHHLLLEVNAVSGASPGPLTLAFYLASKLETGGLKPLSETFTLDVPTPESFATLAHSSKLKTLFTELSHLDFNEGSGGQAQLFLVVTVQASEPARQLLPPKATAPHSRDGASTHSRSASSLNSIKGSQKTRRSMMWASKQRSPEQQRPDVASNAPQSADSANSKEAKAPGAKEASVIRTIGAGILEIAPVMRQNKDIEQIVTIWSPLAEDAEEDHQSEGFDELIRTIISSPTSRYAKSYRASRVQIHLYPFVSADSDTLIRNNPTLMHDVAQTRRMGFPAAPNKPRSDIYLTLSRAAFPHDAVLSHPQTGQAPLPLYSGLRNLQLTLEVRDAAGNRIERCIFPSSSSIGHTAWRTTVAEKGSSWDQTICLKLSADQVVGSHIIMSVANAPEFPFALCWLPLWDQQAFLRDGPHSLLLHAYDKHTSNIDETGKGAYLSLPWNAPGKHERTDSLAGPFAAVRIETNLCSTEFSQDQVILGLINAKDKEATEVLQLLRRVLFVPEIEIVKQLRSVFDALFSILVSNVGNEEYEDLIFNNLVTVLGIVHDRRFNLGPLVDRYIEDQFDFPSATPCLVRSYLRLLQGNIDSPQQSRTLRAAFKVGRHLLKFITNAREQQKEKEVDAEPTQVPVKFNKDMHSIFKALESLMRNPSPVLVGSKTLVVQHFHTWLPELTSVMSKDEMIMIALSFMDSCKDVKGMLILYKLVLIQNYARLSMFASGQDRETFISGALGWLEPYWGITGDVSDQYRDQVRLCSSIVAELLKVPEPQLYLFMPKVVASYCAIALEGVEETNYLSMLYSRSFPFQVKTSNRSQKFDEALVELAGLIAAISNIPDPKRPLLKGDDLAIFLSHSLEAHRSIISCEAYPEDWLSLHIYHHRAAVKGMDFLLSLLIESFLPSPEEADSFDMKLWEAFFATLLKVVSSDALALETYPEQKRRAIWKIGGDVREQGANLLRRSWEAIGWETTDEERERFGLTSRGGFQVQYVPSLVPATVDLCLSVHEGLRRVAVEILQTMILSEWDLNQDLTVIEMEIISSLDVAFQSKEMKENTAQKLFISELMDLFEVPEEVDDDDGLSAAVRELIETIDELLDLLLACHNSGEMSESLHTLRLMEFMKDMGREDIFVRYVHELAQTQAAEHNYAEAGLALQFHADLYDWDVTKLVPVSFNPALPEQTAFERKEALYFEIIQHFEDGKAWTHALASYKDLAEQYEHTVLDFSKLSRAQSSMAKIYEYIAKEHKHFPRYFRVTYKGLGFPPALRDKQFIFEGAPSERMASFTDRMQKQYPAAQVISSGELEDIEGQFLQIAAVNAHRDIGHPVYQRSKIPHSVREHLLVSNPSQFSVTSKRHTSSSDVKDQWVEKTIYTTAEPFPNLLRRSEIVVTEEVSLSPLQTAIERTWRKTQELLLLEQRAVSGDDSTLSGLMEALNQLLDVGSTSSTCVAHYRQFLSQTEESSAPPAVNDTEDEDEEPQSKPINPEENALAVALIDHALAIKHALTLLSRPAHQATQADLQSRFEDAFGPELSSLSVSPPPQTSLTTPRATESRSTQVANGVSRDEHSFARSISPEEGLIRSTRTDDSHKNGANKSSMSQRISIMNPFRKANHATSDSTGTIMSVLGANSSNHQHSDSKASKTNGKTAGSRSRSGSRNESATHLSRRNGGPGVDDDAATVHSGRSRGAQSEKRKSWFGGDSKSANRTSVSLNDVSGALDRPSTQKSMASRDRNDSFAAKSTKSMEETRRFDVRPMNSPNLGSSELTEGNKEGLDQGTALPVNVTPPQTERPLTRESLQFGQPPDMKISAHSVTISAANNPANNSATSGGVRDSVMKRFSLLKGVGRKNSRLNVRDGGVSTGTGSAIAESVHE